jgi:AraC-like DNA-binding protein
MKPQIRHENISGDHISPLVLKALYFEPGEEFPNDFKFPGRYVKNYELEFYIESKGTMLIENTLYHTRPGNVIFRRPGQFVQGGMPYTCYAISFSMQGSLPADDFSYGALGEQSFEAYYHNPVLDSIPSVLKTGSFEKYKYLFNSVFSEFINPTPVSGLKNKAFILEILSSMYEDAANVFALDKNLKTPYYSSIIRSMDYIKNNYQKKLCLKELSKVAAMSPNYFHKMFSKTLGKTPNEYIMEIRLKKAKELLASTRTNIMDISSECGFEDTSYFSYVFKKHFSISPSQFRNRQSYF